jgi:NAD(P)-dependent dehydrogenase (short-subunit alcohol dehydrogenase family)
MSEQGTALITGATRGIGRDVARKLAARGWKVVITGRKQAECDAAAKEIGGQVTGMALDLASLKSVHKFAAAFLEREPRLSLLMNNAGTMFMGKSAQITVDGNEATLQVNALAPLLLTQLLLDRLRASKPARIVNVSSRLHLPKSGFGGEVGFDYDNLKGEKSYNAQVFYKNSKLGVMWWSYELGRRLAGSGVTVNAVCPGFVPATLAEQTHGVQKFLFKHILPHLPSAHSLDEASENSLFASTDPAYAEKSGKFIAEKKEIQSSPDSYDEAKAKRFWELAERLIGSAPSAVRASG